LTAQNRAARLARRRKYVPPRQQASRQRTCPGFWKPCAAAAQKKHSSSFLAQRKTKAKMPIATLFDDKKEQEHRIDQRY